MDLQQERRLVRSLDTYVKLRNCPDKIKDIGLLEKALAFIEAATVATGREYVFKEIQQLSIGSSIDILPKDYNIKTKVNWILGAYDQTYFENRIKELRGEVYS